MPTTNFFSGYNDQSMRVSDAERQAIADRLAVHYADGRLDQSEFDERVGQAMTAKTRADLRGLLDDLPEPGPAGAPGIAGPVRTRHRRKHPILLVALLVFVTLATVHEVFWFAPLLWLGFIVLAALALTGHVGRSRGK